MTRFLTVEQVIFLHDSEKRCALLDRGKLESAVRQPQQTWSGEYLYPTVIHQAAVLLHGICQAHAFEDANKRTAWLAMVTFLELNEVVLADIEVEEIVQLMLGVSSRGWTHATVVDWLLDRC